MPYKYKIVAGIAMLGLALGLGIIRNTNDATLLSSESLQELEELNTSHEVNLYALNQLNKNLEKKLMSAELLASESMPNKEGLIASTTDMDLFLLQPKKELSKNELKTLAEEYKERVPELNHIELDQRIETSEDVKYRSPLVTEYLNSLNQSNDNSEELKPSAPTESSPIRVGVIDSGVDYNHPIFKEVTLEKGWNTVRNTIGAIDEIGHGTHVTGIIASKLPGSTIIPYKVIANDAGGRLSNVMAALEKGLNEDDLDIINMSFGFSEKSDILEEMINQGTENGVIFIAAAGNKKQNTEFYPASYQNVVAVGAANIHLGTLSTSNYGSWIDVTAIGEKVFSAKPDERYSYMSGTSQATAAVTAYVAKKLETEDQEVPTERLNHLMEELHGIQNKVNSGHLEGTSLITE